jgi:hypothetical protein
VAPVVLEPGHGLHEADVALTDEVQELQAPVRVLLGDRDHEAEVGLDELLLPCSAGASPVITVSRVRWISSGRVSKSSWSRTCFWSRIIWSNQFRTGWFLESVVSASLIVIVVRTRRPFFRSRPGRHLPMATLAVVAATGERAEKGHTPGESGRGQAPGR